MSKVTFHQPNGSAQTLEIDDGVSVMRAAVLGGVAGIIGECGGQAMCATCHVYVRGSQYALPSLSEDEDEMLDCAVAPRDPDRSRLGCQLVLHDGGSDLEVEVPAGQV
jgi:2Fe-2S ferredoxin